MIDAIVIPRSTIPVISICRPSPGWNRDGKTADRQIGIEASIETAEGLRNASKITHASDRILSLVFGIATTPHPLAHGWCPFPDMRERRGNLSGSSLAFYPQQHGHACKSYGRWPLMRPMAISRIWLGCVAQPSWPVPWVVTVNGPSISSQVDVINEVFTPSEEDIALASKVIEADRLAKSEGRGAIAVEGRMVDQATVRLAKNCGNRPDSWTGQINCSCRFCIKKVPETALFFWSSKTRS